MIISLAMIICLAISNIATVKQLRQLQVYEAKTFPFTEFGLTYVVFKNVADEDLTFKTKCL